MAPIESSQRALSIGVISFARGHVFNQKTWIDNDFANSTQIKSNHVKKVVKSNQITRFQKGVKSNQIKKVQNLIQIKSNHDLIFAHPWYDMM